MRRQVHTILTHESAVVSRKKLLAILLTTSVLSTIGVEARATASPPCVNSLTGTSAPCSLSDTNFTITQSGEIVGSATDIGVSVSTDYSHALINNGEIALSGNNPTSLSAGIFVDGDLTNTGSLTNNGIISINLGPNGAGTALGIYVTGAVDGSVTNNGYINLSTNTDGDAFSVGILSSLGTNGSFTNNGHINVSAHSTANNDAEAFGFYIGGGIGTITNNGYITANVINDGVGISTASGILTQGPLNGTVRNSVTGAISATATSLDNQDANAIGMDLHSDILGSAINDGSIIVTANSGNTAEAYGIQIHISGGAGTSTGQIINNGSILTTANSTTGTAGGIYIQQAFSGEIINNGTITAINNSPNGRAYGIRVSGGAMTGTITNTGTITTTDTQHPNDAIALYVSTGSGTINNSGIVTGGIATGGSVNIANSGIIALPANLNGSSGALLNNDYTQTGNGKAIFGVASDATYSTLDIGHNGDFTGNSKLGVMLSADNTYAGGVLSNVIAVSNTLTHPNPFTVTDNSLAYNFTASTSGNYVSISSVSTGLTSLSNAVRTTGNTSGGGAAAEMDNLLVNGSTAMIDALSTLVGGVTTNRQASDFVSQTLPLLAGGVEQVTLDTTHNINRIIQNRLSFESGVSSGEDFTTTDRYFWFKPFGSWADQSDRNGVSGYSASTGGAIFGGDAMFNERVRLGTAFVYSHSNVNSNSDVALQSDRIDGYQGIVYGSYGLDELTNMNFQTDIGDNTNNGKRTVGSATAFSSYDSWSEHVGVDVDRKYHVYDEKTVFIPSLRADYTNISSGGYAETGAGPLNLNVSGSDTQEFIIGVDGKISRPLNEYVTLSTNLGVGYDTLAERSSITSNFVGGGASFITKGIDPSPWIGQGGVGLTLNQWQAVEVTARYDLEARSDFTDQTASVKFRMAF